MDKVGFCKGIAFKRNVFSNNTDRNKIPLKDHTMLVSFLYIFLHPQNVCYTLFFGFRTGLGELVLYKIQSVADVHLNPIK